MDWISIRIKGMVGIRNAVSIRVRAVVILGKQSGLGLGFGLRVTARE